MIEKYWNCDNCGKRSSFDFEEEFNLVCGSCSLPLELKYEGKISWNDFKSANNGVLRYAEIIPVSKNNLEKVCDNQSPEFFFPIESRKMTELLGVKSVHVLPSISGLSGTFKDVEAAVVVGKCLDWKLNKRLSWHSTGNTARAYREYAIRGNLKSDSYFPLSCISKFRGIKKDRDNMLIAFDGPFQQISSIAKNRAKKNDTIHLAPLPWKIEGKATLAYSIFENLPETNVLVQTIAGGYGMLGLELGIERIKQLGLGNIEKYRYELFQIEGADTFAKLMPLNREIFETDLKLPVNPFEPTLQSTNPLSTFNLVRKIVNETKSGIDSVTKDEVIDGREFFEKECQHLGIDISFEDEKSPFISWSGLMKAKKNKRLLSSDKIVIIVTGSRKRKGEIPTPDLILN